MIPAKGRTSQFPTRQIVCRYASHGDCIWDSRRRPVAVAAIGIHISAPSNDATVGAPLSAGGGEKSVPTARMLVAGPGSGQAPIASELVAAPASGPGSGVWRGPDVLGVLGRAGGQLSRADVFRSWHCCRLCLGTRSPPTPRRPHRFISTTISAFISPALSGDRIV
jgi:hypothetical protein